jgi:adhesin transport system membrane fusion protein
MSDKQQENKPAGHQDEQSDKESINKPSGWAKVQNEWAQEKLDIAQARADKFFAVDDELPLRKHLLLSFIAIFFVLFIVWANIAKLDEVTRGDGKVIPSTEIQVIQHQEGGIVAEFMVREGDIVKTGEVLMRLSDVGATSDLGSNRQRYLGLSAKAQRLQAEAEGLITPKFSEDVLKGVPQSVTEELNTFRANQQNVMSQAQILEQQLSQRQQEIRELNTRIRDLRDVIRLSKEEMAMIAPLVERGSAPKVELLQLERGIKERQTELNGLLTSLPRIQSSVEEAQARIEELKNNLRAQAQTELAATQIEMNSIKETLSALSDRQKRTDIRSPVDGTIKDFKINTVGGVIQPGQEVIEIVPMDDQLLVEAQIRPSDIAFLYPGQPAIVKITAYDFSIYGGLKGELVDISADTITNEEGESFYRVRIRTPETRIKRNGEELPIIPGMVASVDILTGKKSVMEYILKPLIKTLGNAMNER